MRLAPFRWSLAVALALLTGCQAATAPATARRTPRPAAASAADGKPLLAPKPTGATRPAPAEGPLTQLTGKAKLISDHGAAIISNNTGGIVANNGGTILANNAAGLVSNNGPSLEAKYAVAQAGPVEAPLADAFVEVLDGEGRQLVDADGEAIGAFTDATGAYAFAAPLPAENLVLRVRLFPNGGARAAGGELLAILPKGEGARGADLDTAASLGAAYVLDRFVGNRPQVLDKLPAAEALALRREALAAIAAAPPEAPTYRVADQVAATEALRGAAKGLDDALERIRAILVAGASIRAGRPARDVALAGPAGLATDAGGNLFVAEVAGGRIRVLRPDGTMALFAGGVSTTAGKDGDDALDIGFETPQGLAVGPDGALYVADRLRNHVRRLETGADGITRVTIVAGDGRGLQGPVGGRATATSIQGPTALAFAPDGRLFIGEMTKAGGVAGRLLVLEPDGTLRQEALPPWGAVAISDLAFTKDGALVVVNEDDERVYRRDGAGAWTKIFEDEGLADFAGVAVAPDGAVWLSADLGHAIWRIGADGLPAKVAGTGEQGHAPDGTAALAARLNRPGALRFDAAGRLLFAENGNGLVRRLDPAAPGSPLETVAGTTGLGRQGNAQAIAISGPGGVALDAQGRLIVAETTGHTIRRLEGDALTVIAGNGAGYAGDGGPWAAARFESPGALCRQGDDLLVMDVSNKRIRRLAADGTVRTVVGDGRPHAREPWARKPATESVIARGWAIAVGPDGRIYWSDNHLNRVVRLAADGMAEVVAGHPDGEGGDAGDDGPAIGARLHGPTALAFDARGDLFVADTANMRIRRITGLAGGAPTIHAAAGAGIAGVLAGADDPGDVPAAAAAFFGPISLAFTGTGELLVGEAGAAKLRTLVGFAGIGDLPLPPIGSRIRRITAPGTAASTVTTVAGHGTRVLNDPRSDDSMNTPLGLLVDAEGRLVITDSGNNQVKLLPKGAF